MRRWFAALALLSGGLGSTSAIAFLAPGNAPPPPHGFFSALTRQFARFERFDQDGRTLVFTLENGGTLERPATPALDVMLYQLPAEPEELEPGSRVWIALEGKPGAPGVLRFVADEQTYQALHGYWYSVRAVDTAGRRVILAPPGARAADLALTAAAEFKYYSGRRELGLADLRAGDLVRYQTGGTGELRRATSQLAWSFAQSRQAQALRRALDERGLPARFTAREDTNWVLTIDRAGSERARRLRPGERVSLSGAGPDGGPVEVAAVAPWGEKTLVTLRAGARGAPAAGQSLRVHAAPAPLDTQIPAGLNIATRPDDRIEWFLSTIYCTCPVRGDQCTGHLYTLSMCNPQGCGKPAAMRAHLKRLIESGLNDAQILRRLEQEEGPSLLQPHLLQ